MTSDLEALGKAGALVCAWRVAHGFDPDHVFFCVENPHGFKWPVLVAVERKQILGNVVITEIPDNRDPDDS